MTENEKTLAHALAACSFVPGTGTKRFAKDMAARAELPKAEPLTSSQRRYLLTAVVRFRRQVPRRLVELARQELASDTVAVEPRC